MSLRSPFLPMLLAAVGCAGTAGPERPERPPDIILLVPTGLRAGAAEQALYDAWGAQPVQQFTNAYAQSCAPFTSMGSMLASRYPTSMTLCATRDVNSVGDSKDRPWCARIPDEVWTLPEVLKVYGYASAAAVPAAAGIERNVSSAPHRVTKQCLHKSNVAAHLRHWLIAHR